MRWQAVAALQHASSINLYTSPSKKPWLHVAAAAWLHVAAVTWMSHSSHEPNADESRREHAGPLPGTGRFYTLLRITTYLYITLIKKETLSISVV